MSRLLVQFGAGNIGRSFIGPLFRRGGYALVYVDADAALVDRLNRAGAYRIVLKKSGRTDEIVTVDGFTALHTSDTGAIQSAILDADLACTAVGQGALARVLALLARALQFRAGLGRRRPLDLILAENMRGVSAYARTHLAAELPAGYPIEDRIGLVETSIGKMVPLMSAADLREDALQLFAEPYNTLIVDAGGFRNGVPDVPGLAAVDNIRAYVDRKLFIHNLGHAAAAYLGFARHGCRHIWEALEFEDVRDRIRRAMEEAAAALHAEYPDALPRDELRAHIADLLDRFSNRALGDTVYRVGRDLRRKLGPEDRLLGAMRLAARHGLPFQNIAEAFAAATRFDARDENGRAFPADASFLDRLRGRDLSAVFAEDLQWSPADAPDQAVRDAVLQAVSPARRGPPSA